MKLLVLVNDHEHGHDYGVDHLCAGLYSTLGADNVFDWPEKPCLHLGQKGFAKERDQCEYDSDNSLPSKGKLKVEDIIPQVDAVLIAVSWNDRERLRRTHDICKDIPRSIPIAALDQGDQVMSFHALYSDIAGRPLAAYFKRELPIGAPLSWQAIPCPLSYPASKVPDVLPPKEPRIFYHATTHENGAYWKAGVERRKIVTALRVNVPASKLDVQIYPDQKAKKWGGERLSVEEYNERKARCMIGLAWNGAPNWDNNRFWSNMAYGLAQVAETPRIQIPHMPETNRHVIFKGEWSRVPTTMMELLRDPEQALKLGEAGREHWRQFHTSEKRADYVIERIGAVT